MRQGVLAATLAQPSKWWYLSELADRLGTTPSSLQRELSSLVASGILSHRREGTMKGRKHFVKGGQSDLDEIVGK
jgi:predicted transcriptional regulator